MIYKLLIISYFYVVQDYKYMLHNKKYHFYEQFRVELEWIIGEFSILQNIGSKFNFFRVQK